MSSDSTLTGSGAARFGTPRGGRAFSLTALMALLAMVAGLGGGCSVRRLAVNKVADALTGGGTTFTSDDDPELVADALPFSLKLMESLLAEAPEHEGLLLTLASGFTQYTYGFVQMAADEREAADFSGAEAQRARARRLYLRARGYGLRGIEVDHPGFARELAATPRVAAARLHKAEVPFAYWTAASWAALIALSKDDPSRLAEIPQMEALLDRAAELDADWGDGSIHSLLITYEMSRQDVAGDPAVRARRHFNRAMELSRGRRAGPLVSLAESVSVEKQDAAEFNRVLKQALAIDPAAHPESRLENLLMQRRARWLLSRAEDLFLNPVSGDRP